MSYTNPGPSVTTGDTRTGLASPWGAGQDANSLVGFYGATPVAQRASSFQASSVVSVSSNITIAASLTAWILEVTNTLVGLGIWKGSA
jgi:hypothetical protein